LDHHALSPAVAGTLRKARHERGLSLLEMARVVGTTKGYLAELELGRKAPSNAMAVELIRGYRLNPDEATVLLRESVQGVGRDKAKRKAAA
jgi:transcriptional regulator with XRE-family HTH domain